MSWFKLESSPMCHDKEKDKEFIEDNFLSMYCRYTPYDTNMLRDMFITGVDRASTNNGWYNKKHRKDNNEKFPVHMVKFGHMYKTKDYQFFYMFNCNYPLNEIKDAFSDEWQQRNNIKVKIIDKKDNWIFRDYYLVVMWLVKREVPILK